MKYKGRYDKTCESIFNTGGAKLYHELLHTKQI